MSRTVAWGPDPSDRGDLVYVEDAQRERSLHVLLQDLAGPRLPRRRQFLLNLLRECVERFGARGRIEHPLVLAREIARAAEGLAARADGRVENPAGLGVFVVLRHGASVFVLASRDGSARVRTPDGWRPLRDVAVELPMVERVQPDLFGRSMTEALGLWRLDAPDGLDLVVGGLDAENVRVCEAVDSPAPPAHGAGEGGELTGVAHRVLALHFDSPAPTRIVAAGRPRAPGRPDAVARHVALTAVALALVTLSGWGVWSVQRAVRARGDATELARTIDGNARRRAQREPRAGDAAEASGGDVSEASGGDVSEASGGDVSEASAGDAEGVHPVTRWSLTFGRPVTTTPLVRDGVAIFGTREGRVYAVDVKTGRERWRVETGAGVGASPVPVGDDVVVATYAGDVLRLDPRGRRVWRRGVGAHVGATPTPAGDVVVVGAFDGRVHALEAGSGRVRWRFRTGGRIRARAARAGGLVVVPSYDGTLYALALRDGRVRWRRRTGVRMAASPVVHDDAVIAGTDDGRVIAVDAATGRVRWTHREKTPVRSFLAARDDAVFVGVDDGSVVCLSADDGSERWRARTGGRVMSQPALLGPLLAVSSYDARLHVIDAHTGAEIATHPLGAPAFSSPVRVGRGVLVGTNGGRLLCIDLVGAPAM